MADHEDYDLGGADVVEVHQPIPREDFNVIQAVAASLKATVTQLSIVRTVQQPVEASLKAIVSVNDFQELIDEVKLLRNCNLLVTGQTTEEVPGDDGDLENGVIKSYSVLDAGDYAGTSNITINGKTHALSNNCVKDNKTGLMWSRYVPIADIGPATDGKLYWSQWVLANKVNISFDATNKKIISTTNQFTATYTPAGRIITVTGSVSNNGTYTVVGAIAREITVVEALTDEVAGASVTISSVDDLIWNVLDEANSNSLGGHDDWRVPNIAEYFSIIDYSTGSPAIDVVAFPSTPSDMHFSSTTRPGNNNYAMAVYWDIGEIQDYYKYSVPCYIRLVRG